MSANYMDKPLCIVIGVGPGNGMNITRRFVDAGYCIAILARRAEALEEFAAGQSDVYPFACDMSDPVMIDKTLGNIGEQLGVPHVVVYNAGSGMFGGPLDITLEEFEQSWRVNALGLLATSQKLIPDMVGEGGGHLVIMGATASVRGGAKFTAFSAAKGAQRNLAQSLARSFGPQGIHVALVIIDGVIDIPRTREMMPDKSDECFLQPSAIAESVYQLTLQRSSAWTFELDLRPGSENW
jgi:NAD(P)-dependent dehydrogenase (short-subunit alcohol dehydrogenase family)